MFRKSASLRAGWNDHDDCRKAFWLTLRLRVQVTGGTTPRPIFHRHPWWKRHRLVAEASHLEHVRRRFLEHERTAFVELSAVVRDDVGKRSRGAVDVVALAATRVIRREELSRWVNWKTYLACRRGSRILWWLCGGTRRSRGRSLTRRWRGGRLRRRRRRRLRGLRCRLRSRSREWLRRLRQQVPRHSYNCQSDHPGSIH